MIWHDWFDTYSLEQVLAHHRQEAITLSIKRLLCVYADIPTVMRANVNALVRNGALEGVMSFTYVEEPDSPSREYLSEEAVRRISSLPTEFGISVEHAHPDQMSFRWECLPRPPVWTEGQWRFLLTTIYEPFVYQTTGVLVLPSGLSSKIPLPESKLQRRKNGSFLVSWEDIEALYQLTFHKLGSSVVANTLEE